MAHSPSQKIDTLVNWGIFTLALVVYALTSQQSVMFWDSGEFIASSHKLQATHPPGAPLYTLLSRLFLLLFPTSLKAYGASLFSALCGAFTVFLLYRIINWTAIRSFAQEANEEIKQWLPMAGAVIGSMTYLFSDSFWTSSTEAEVYTLSTLFMAIGFWAATKWDEAGNTSYAWRWLLLILFVLGLSVGVHILNFAILFPTIMLIYLKRFGLSLKNVFIALFGALFLFLLLNTFLVQGVLGVLGSFEMYAVNSAGLPQHIGSLMGIVLFVILSIAAILYARQKGKNWLEFIIVGFLCFSLGWSTYTLALLRSDAQTPSSNNAEDVLELRSYLRSDQFGFSNLPLIKGPSFNSPRDGDKEFIDGPPTYAFDEEKQQYIQIESGKNSVPNYIDESIMLFPRMWNTEAINVNGYKQWIDYEGEATSINVIIGGQRQALRLPTMSENLAFFFNYQLGWLNWRYFLWNFAGRQNNYKGTGHPLHGNWQSGIEWFDQGRIGKMALRPKNLLDHPSSNSFYFLPLLLGLLGIYFLYKNGISELLILGLFFLAFGVAITVFINQLPIHIQIRERDYIFLGAYFAFSAFVGIGVLGLFSLLPDKISVAQRALISFAICLILVPSSMAIQGWDEHDRSGELGAEVMAKHMLDQCEDQAILIVSGDNVTFPLWYLQEVENYRADVRVIDYNLLGLEWYNRRLLRKINTSEPLRLEIQRSFYKKNQKGTFPYQKVERLKNAVEVGQLLKYIAKEGKEGKIPTDQFRLNVGADAASFQNIAWDKLGLKPKRSIEWNLKKDRYSINDIAMLDLLNSNLQNRTVYFSNTGRSEFGMGLEAYFLNRGLVNQLIPAESIDATNMIEGEQLYQLLIKDYDFTAYADTTELLNPIHEDFARSIFINRHIELAEYFLNKEDTQRSLEVLDHAVDNFPNEKIEYDYQSIQLAKLYLQNGDVDTWRSMTDQIMKNIMKKVSWLLSFQPQHPFITYQQTFLLSNHLTLLMNEIASQDPGYESKFVPEMDRLNQEFSIWINQDDRLLKAQINN